MLIRPLFQPVCKPWKNLAHPSICQSISPNNLIFRLSKFVTLNGDDRLQSKRQLR